MFGAQFEEEEAPYPIRSAMSGSSTQTDENGRLPEQIHFLKYVPTAGILVLPRPQSSTEQWTYGGRVMHKKVNKRGRAKKKCVGSAYVWNHEFGSCGKKTAQSRQMSKSEQTLLKCNVAPIHVSYRARTRRPECATTVVL